MPSVPPDLLTPLKDVLFRCIYFPNTHQLNAIFLDTRLNVWQHEIPTHASSHQELVEQLIAYLSQQYNSDYNNLLVLFLTVLKEQYSDTDARHWELNYLSHKIQDKLNKNSTLPFLINSFTGSRYYSFRDLRVRYIGAGILTWVFLIIVCDVVYWGQKIPPLLLNTYLNGFENPKAGIVVGVPVGSLLLLYFMAQGVSYLPLTFEQNNFARGRDFLPTTSLSNVNYFIKTLWVIFIPVLACLFFLATFLAGEVLVNGEMRSIWYWDSQSLLRMWYTDSDYRLFGTEYYPLVEPILFIVFEIAVIGSFFRLVARLRSVINARQPI